MSNSWSKGRVSVDVIESERRRELFGPTDLW